MVTQLRPGWSASSRPLLCFPCCHGDGKVSELSAAGRRGRLKEQRFIALQV